MIQGNHKYSLFIFVLFNFCTCGYVIPINIIITVVIYTTLRFCLLLNYM